MILSLSHRFIFIHIPKTAGTAMAQALQPFASNPRRTVFRSLVRRFPIRQAPGKAYFRKHEASSDVISKLGRNVYDEFFSFCVVRNPYDHAVSHFEFMKQFRITSVARRVSKMSFREYLLYRSKRPFWNDTFFARLPCQSHFVSDGLGRLLVKKVLRYENLAEDFGDLVSELGLRGVVLEKVNQTPSRSACRPFQEYYTRHEEELVRILYARDFEVFGYDLRLR